MHKLPGTLVLRGGNLKSVDVTCTDPNAVLTESVLEIE